MCGFCIFTTVKLPKKTVPNYRIYKILITFAVDKLHFGKTCKQA